MRDVKNILEQASGSDLGKNVHILHNVIQHYKNASFVDLGVRGGTSSSVFLINAKENNNTIYGVDVDQSPLSVDVKNNERYKFILGDSVTVGKNWNREKLDMVFIDTFHIKEQVLCELYYWTKHIKKDSCIVFHDCNWPAGKHDEYGNVKWGRVEEAIKEFFNINDLNTENNMIKSVLCPDSWGMCFVRIKQDNIKIPTNINWQDVFNRRNYLISLFWNEDNKKDVAIELVI